MITQRTSTNVPTGCRELDDILSGGFAHNRIHLIEGRPGSGKTTLALQFLISSRDRGERGIYITLSEGRDELLQSAESHGWDLSGIEIFELVPAELSLDPAREQSVVYSSDLELGETIRLVIDETERFKPANVVFDSLSDIRLLAGNALRYRRQVLALKHFFEKSNCTALFVDDLTEEMDDANLHSLVHGVVRLEQQTISYGAERRRLRVFKMRGRPFRGGYHDYVVRTGGIRVFPRLVAAEHKEEFAEQPPVSSGIETLDRMLRGGLERGTSSLIMGPAGSGKSSLSLQYVRAALERGEEALFVSFDETWRNFNKRSRGLGIELEEYGGRFHFQQVDPAEFSAGELLSIIQTNVEAGVSVVVLDSLSGYQHAMPDEQHVLLQMHELLTYLNQKGILTILVLAQHGLIGTMSTSLDLTYLADTVLLLRFFETRGELKRAISVMKKRTGGHEASIREYRIDQKGIRVGAPLRRFSGVLSGIPAVEQDQETALPDREFE